MALIIFPFSFLLLGDRHAIRSNFTLRAHNHFYRCRGIKENKTTVKQHDCGSLLPSLTVTDVCAIFAKT